MPILERVNNLNGEFTMKFTKYNVSVDKSLSHDAGLRAYMLQVFNFMGIALIDGAIGKISVPVVSYHKFWQ